MGDQRRQCLRLHTQQRGQRDHAQPARTFEDFTQFTLYGQLLARFDHAVGGLKPRIDAALRVLQGLLLHTDGLFLESEARAVALPAEVGFADTGGEHQCCRLAFSRQRARAIDGRFDAGLLLSPPVELVAQRDAKVRLAIPVIAEKFRRKHAVVAEPLV